MKRPWISLSLVCFSLFTVGGAVRAQDVDNEVIAAVKKTALVVDARGSAPIKPTTFYLKADVYADGTGRALLQDKYQKSLASLRSAVEKAGFHIDNVSSTSVLRRVGETSFQGMSGPESGDAPTDVFRVAGYFTFSAASPERVRAAFSAMRATGATGDLSVNYGVRDEEAAHRAALKVAIAQAKQRVQVLSEAAKPKTFELAYLKEAEFQAPSFSTTAPLQGKESLRVLDTINAETSITLFYGFRPVTGAAPAPKAVASKNSAVSNKHRAAPVAGLKR